MSSESDCTDWDLGSVISLSHALSTAQTSVYHQHVSPATGAGVDKPDSIPMLGNFDRLWEYLGQPKETPPHIQARLDRVVSTGRDTCADQPQADGGESEDETVRAEDDINGYKIAQRVQGDMRNGKAGTWPGRRTKREAREAKRLIENAGDLRNTQVEHLNFRDFRDLPCEGTIDISLFNLPRSPLRRFSTSSPSHWSPDPRDTLWMASNLGRTNHREIPVTTSRISYKPPAYVYKSAAEKKATLILKLHAAFEADRGYLTSTTTSSPKNQTGSIHIFVDFSNILWGFFDYLQTSRKTHVYSDMRRPPFSFHSLSLVMERGRPTAKKVLVGSKPLIPEFKEAEECGYETNILERVLKDPDPRKVRRLKSGYGTSDPSSSSEANTPPPQRSREQAVDEVLHLKIMETLVDYDKPATIVLATGDAAEAEYSDGFMKMVQRALRRGWRVELVSFRACISGAYLNKRFRAKWGDHFIITELDEYAEELVGSSSGTNN